MIDPRLRSTRRRRMCSCPHLRDFKKADGLKVFRKIHAHFVSCGSREARKRKVQHIDFGCKFPRWSSAGVSSALSQFYCFFSIFVFLRPACVIATTVERTPAVSTLAFFASISVVIPETDIFSITLSQQAIL